MVKGMETVLISIVTAIDTTESGEMTKGTVVE